MTTLLRPHSSTLLNNSTACDAFLKVLEHHITYHNTSQSTLARRFNTHSKREVQLERGAACMIVHNRCSPLAS
jgi:hypothetical protein